MRRLTGLEKCCLVLALLFLTVGAEMAFRPTELAVFHQAYRNNRGRSYFEAVSKDEARVYGFLIIAFGTGLVGMVFYARRK